MQNRSNTTKEDPIFAASEATAHNSLCHMTGFNRQCPAWQLNAQTNCAMTLFLHFYCFQTEVEVAEPSWARKLLSLIISKDEQSEDDGKSDERPGNILITTAATEMNNSLVVRSEEWLQESNFTNMSPDFNSCSFTMGARRNVRSRGGGKPKERPPIGQKAPHMEKKAPINRNSRKKAPHSEKDPHTKRKK